MLLKGYTSEGHDSANTDYGGHYNQRAGGLEDMNDLIASGKANYNADFSVHVNATEVYPQANAFSDRMIQGQGLGWGWMNQSYGIDQRWDLGGGHVLDRFEQLHEESPELDGVYIDVYYSSGWLAESLAGYLNDDLDMDLGSEWAYSFEGQSIWSHWANDKAYGGAENKGINSDIARFIGNSQRDTWNYDALLGGLDLRDFEGWTAKDDWNNYYSGIWTHNLPTKFVQHFPIESWEPGERAELADDVVITADDDQRVITMGGVEVLRSDLPNAADYSSIMYLLPWGDTDQDRISSPTDANRMYLYSDQAGTHEFELTEQFRGAGELVQYRLTDNGREEVARVSPQGNSVSFETEAGVAYVVAPGRRYG